ncbi:MAG: glycosyl hydrolase [Thermoguttaceae bacterium]
MVCFAGDISSADLEKGFGNPPMESRIYAYWWWLNGNVTPQAITRDLEEMKKMGWGGAAIFDANGANQRENRNVPAGPLFGSEQWRGLFVHTLREADRLGLELSLNIQSGWNVGGPNVQPETAAKTVVWSETQVAGGNIIDQSLPTPKHDKRYYRDIAVVGYKIKADALEASQTGKKIERKPIRDLALKIASQELAWSCPDGTPLLMDEPPVSGEEDTHIGEVVDLTKYLDQEGRFVWDAPEGKWEILRFGYTITGAQLSTSSGNWQGLAIDYLDPEAFRTYWKQVVDPLLSDAVPWTGRTLKYLHTDSWENGGMNWTKDFPQEFRRRRGYDILPFLPVLAGRIVENRAVSNRFLNDFRKTVGDCIAENHYGVFAELAHLNKLEIHPESGGPHGAPIDALKCLGRSDIPMMEFWARSPQHRVKDEDRFFVKQGASAAHIYGKKFVNAEGFTNIGLHWEESLGNNLKPAFDRAACEGLNRLYWHAFTCSPDETGMPGQEYFAGTHCNPTVTWWKYSGDFVKYLNRCQYLLQQGLFVADACYYQGDNVPNFARLKSSDPAKVLPGYDYDVVNEEVLLNRMQVRDGRLVLPDGMSYRVMVLPGHQIISLEALRKLAQLVQAGAVIIGPKPVSVTGLNNYPSCDAELAELAGKMWGPCEGRTITQNIQGKGRVIWGKSAKDVLAADGVQPDFECHGDGSQDALNYIHRAVGDIDIYFISNPSNRAKYYQCTFRVADKTPELWSPDTGEIRKAMIYDCQKDGRISMPLYFEPYGAVFVVFRVPAEWHKTIVFRRHRRPKTFVVFRGSAGPHFTSLAKDGKMLFPYAPGTQTTSPVEIIADKDGRAALETREKGNYEMQTAAGQTVRITVAEPLSRNVAGPWQVHFAPGWGAPESIEFKVLKSWTENADPNVKYFSGAATYVRDIDIPAEMLESNGVLELDLGELSEMAEVSLNGRSLGVLWKSPFRIDISAAARAGKNRLEIQVVNSWANRLIGDQKLPPDERKTKTNITKFEKGNPQPLPSGLFGPVLLRKIPLMPCQASE